jgi:hypothetical protein
MQLLLVLLLLCMPLQQLLQGLLALADMLLSCWQAA